MISYLMIFFKIIKYKFNLIFYTQFRNRSSTEKLLLISRRTEFEKYMLSTDYYKFIFYFISFIYPCK